MDEAGYDFQRTTQTAIAAIAPTVPIVEMANFTHGYYDKTVMLRCRVMSLVPFTVQWYRENEPLGNEFHFPESAEAVWAINDASSSSEGRYVCNATNAAGSSRAITYLDVKGNCIIPGSICVLWLYS